MRDNRPVLWDNRPARKPRRISWLAWVLIVVAFGVGTVFGLGLDNITTIGTGSVVADNAVADAAPTVPPTSADTPATTVPPTTAPPATAAPATPSYGAGTYVVGEDIQPGVYRTAGPADSALPNCYWERLSGLSGEFKDLIANENLNGPGVVEIAPSDAAFHTNGCKPWTRE